MIRDEVVERRRWVTADDFSAAVLLGQTLPGPLAVDAVIYIGYRLRGWVGAAVAGVALFLPSFLLMLALTVLYLHYGQLPLLAGALKGLSAAVVALIVAAAYRMGKPSLRDPRSLALLVGALLALLIFKANALLIIAIAGIAGMILYRGPAASSPDASSRDHRRGRQ
jgi:chromate transporter